MHSDSVQGDPNSLNEKRLKEEVTPMSGARALDILSQIEGRTYERQGLQQLCLGLIADGVEEAIDQLVVDDAVGQMFHDGKDYKALDYSRLGGPPDPGGQQSQRPRQVS